MLTRRLHQINLYNIHDCEEHCLLQFAALNITAEFAPYIRYVIMLLEPIAFYLEGFFVGTALSYTCSAINKWRTSAYESNAKCDLKITSYQIHKVILQLTSKWK